MLQICPVSVRSQSVEITKIGLRLQSQALFVKKMIGTAVSGLSIGSFWVWMFDLLAFLASKKL